MARISLGKQRRIDLGDLWPRRDWGYAGDDVRGMWQMKQRSEPDDWRPYSRQDPRFMRPEEVDILLGDPTKAETVLGWERDVDFRGIVKLMVVHDLELQRMSLN